MSANSSGGNGKATPYQKKLFWALSGRFNRQFGSRYGSGWAHQWKNDKEKEGLLFSYALAAEAVGGEDNAKEILRWLASTQNTKYLDFPPTPQQFIGLWRQIPKPMRTFRNKALEKNREITLNSRVWVNLVRMISGIKFNERDKDIKDLIEYNFKKYQEHINLNGLPIPGSKTYEYFRPILEIKGV